MKFVISTQYLENYGAHCEDGKFSSGNAYWKFKGGSDYVVSGVERLQDAVAYVAALSTANNISWKEFPSWFGTYDEWLDTDPGEYFVDNAKQVDPREG